MSSQVESLHPILECAKAITTQLNEASHLQATFLSPAEKEAAVTALEACRSQLLELELRVVASCGDVAAEHGARDVGSWLRQHTRSDGGPARGLATLAQALDARWAGVRAGMAEGAVSLEQARVIVEALDALPDRLGAEVVAQAETKLVGYAADFRPTELRRLGRHILDVVAPEIAEAEEAARLRDQERAADRATSLTIRHHGDGTSRLSATLSTADAARLSTYLDAYTSPRQSRGAAGGQGLNDLEQLPAARRRGHAFVALLELLDPHRLPEHGGDTTTVLVTLSLEQLRQDLATAGMIDADLTAGDNLTADQARRLACTAGIIPVVLGGKSEVLDLGRTRRLFNKAQHKAMRLRDKRCRADGCTIPATWTEAHHLRPWSQGGRTDLADGILLCSWHHHRIHDPAMDHEFLPNGDVRFHRRR